MSVVAAPIYLPSRTSRKSSRALDLYFLFIALATLGYATVLFTHLLRNWLLADWLINYNGGFVRRGLLGELFFLASRATHLSATVFVVLFNIVLYAALLIAIRSLAQQSSRSFWVLALIVSPATLAFPLLDPVAGFHKEILFLAFLAVFTVALKRASRNDTNVALCLCVAVPFLILSHEAILFYLPYLLGALLLSGRSLRRSAAILAIPLVLGIASAAICSYRSGNQQTSKDICSSIGYTYQASQVTTQVCSGGAIAYLAYTRDAIRAETASEIGPDHFIPVYLTLALLALLPAIAGSRSLARKGLRRQVSSLWVVASFSILATGALFYLADDWGRWIYIHILAITILLLSLDRSSSPVLRDDKQRMLGAVFLFLYATTWTLPHLNGPGAPHFGYADLARQLHRYAKRYREIRTPVPVASVHPSRYFVQ